MRFFLTLLIVCCTVQSNVAAQAKDSTACGTCSDCCGEFHQQLQKYANPSVCPMVLCNGKCADRADACGALSGSTVLDLQNPGHFICERNCRQKRN